MTEILGYVLLQLKKFIKEEHGENVFNEVAQMCPVKCREVITDVILSNEMYDLQLYEDFLETVKEKLGLSEIEKFGCHIARDQLKGLYGILARFLTIDKLVSRAPAMWAKQFSSGTLSVERRNDRHFIVKIHDFSASKTHKTSFLNYFMELVRIASGKKNVSGTITEINDSTTNYDIILP